MKKIIVFGDNHGIDYWRKFADLEILIDHKNMFTDYDLYVFLGDYTDSFDKTNVEIMQNLNKLARLKSNYPKQVVLLLGNHDLQYLYNYNEHGCSGFRPEAWFDLNDYFVHHEARFQAAFQIENIIFTHAGIHRGWYNVEFPFNSPDIASDLNGALHQKVQCLFDVGHRRGGFKHQGGPFWADKHETLQKPLKGYHQVMGHTPVPEVKVYDTKDGHKLFYCDCLGKGKALELTINDDKSIAYKQLEVELEEKFYASTK